METGSYIGSREVVESLSLRMSGLWVHLNSLGERPAMQEPLCLVQSSLWVHLNSLGEPTLLRERKWKRVVVCILDFSSR